MESHPLLLVQERVHDSPTLMMVHSLFFSDVWMVETSLYTEGISWAFCWLLFPSGSEEPKLLRRACSYQQSHDIGLLAVTGYACCRWTGKNICVHGQGIAHTVLLYNVRSIRNNVILTEIRRNFICLKKKYIGSDYITCLRSHKSTYLLTYMFTFYSTHYLLNTRLLKFRL